MKIDKIRLIGASSVDLPIEGADVSGPFVLKNADGLGPPNVDVAIAVTIQEGGKRQGRRAQNRQPVLRVGIQPNWDVGQTAAELRTILYGLLTPKYGWPVILQLVSNNVVIAQSQGDISAMEAAIFAKDPEVQITLDCDYPYFLAPDILYQLPTKSVVGGKTAIDVANDGTAPTGFWMGVTLQSAQVSPIQLSDDAAEGEHMDIAGAWEAGDTLIVDTRAGQRGVWKIASGTTVAVSVLSNLNGAVSTWLQLHADNNRLMLNNLAFDWYQQGFGHTPSYWGV